MKKKAFMAAITVFAPLLSLLGTQFGELAKANPYAHYPYPLPYLTIDSPSNQTTYFPNVSFKTTTLCIRYDHVSGGFLRFETIQWLNYSLDGGTPQPLSWVSPGDFYSAGADVSFTMAHGTSTNINLTGLSEGSHVISVSGETTFHSGLSSTVTFEVISELR